MVMEMLRTEPSKTLVHALTIVLVQYPEGMLDNYHIGFD